MKFESTKNKQLKIKQKVGSLYVIFILVCSGLFIIIPPNSKISTANEAPSSTDRVDNDFYNGTLSNLTINGYGMHADLRLISFIKPNWTLQSPTTAPRGRYENTLVQIYGTDKILLFGGWIGTLPHNNNNTWIYDLSDDTWIKNTPKVSPKPLQQHAMASIWGDDKALLFGGSGVTSLLDETWTYDLSEDKWTKKEPQNKPPGRNWHEMASIDGTDKIVLFGGNLGSSSFDDTWVYDLSDNNWTQKTPKNKPSARQGHAMATIYRTDKVLLFGGVNLPQTNDTWIYDLSDDNWTHMIPIDPNPDSRFYYSLTSIYGTDKVLLFGGFTTKFENDVWLYNVSNNTWMELNLTYKPSERGGHRMISIFGTDKIILFGGGEFPYKNDTWIFDLSEYVKIGTFISQPYDIGPNASFKKICWEANIPINTSFKLQLRSGENLLELENKSFVGPGGTSISYYISSPTDIWSGHNGDRWVQYKAFFKTINGNDTPILKNVTITYNYWPNTTLISPINGNITNNNKPFFKWNFTDSDSRNQSDFQVLIDDNNEFESIDYNSEEQSSTNYIWQFPNGTSYTALPDGTWYWKARTKDNDGTWGLYSQPWKLIIDTRPPRSTISTPINNEAYFNVKTISGLALDPINGTGLDKIEITIQRLSDTNYWAGTSWISNETWLLTSGISNWLYDCAFVEWISGNQYRVRSRAIDNATNVETPTIGNVFTIDQDRPISNIDYPADNSYLNDLDIITGSAFDVKDYGIKSVEISIKRFGDRKYWTGSNWVTQANWLLTSGNNSWSYNTSSIPWTSGALYWIQSRAIDKASNMEIPGMGIRFYIDMTKPNSEIEIPLNNSFVNNLKEISGSAVDIGGAGIFSMEISIKQFNAAVYWGGVGWTFDETWLEVKGTERWIFNSSAIDWKTDTNYIIRSRAMDNASNIEIPRFGVTFMFDNKPPNNSIIINGDEEYTNSYNVVLSLEAEDSGSGVDQMAFSTDRISWGLWVHFASEMAFDLPPMDGEKVIHCRVRDLAGNIAEPAFDTIILDTTPPEQRSIIINDHAKYSKSEIVLLILSATDSLSGVSKMTFSFDSQAWSPWEPFDTKKSIKIPTVDGKKIVYFKVMDNAGNFALAADSIILDTSPPHSLTLLVDYDKSDSESIILSLSAFDNLSGVYQMSFSFDGFTWGPWEDFAHFKYYPLPTDEKVKFIYFRANDHAGNTAEPVSTNIPKGQDEGPGEPAILSEYWYILLVILIIIFIVIIIIFVRKRRRPEEQKEPVEEAIMVKPGVGPETESSIGEMPSAPTLPQLPETTTVSKTQHDTPSNIKPPTLASSTTPGQVPETQQIPQIAQVPQLPSVTTVDDTNPKIIQESNE